MKRSELYALVWGKPLRKLALELGLSDVGLAKVCKRMDVPVPGLGYWNKVAAGLPVPTIELPPMATDIEIGLPSPADVRRKAVDAEVTTALRAAARDGAEAIPLPKVAIRPTLEDCHPLVKKTARTFARITADLERRNAGKPGLHMVFSPQTSFGRYTSGTEGEFRIAASLARVDWILRFHDALIRGLRDCGCTIGIRGDDRSHRVEIRRNREAVDLTFAEEFDKVVKGSSRGGYVAGAAVQFDYRPKDSFKVKLQRGDSIVKQWIGSATQLEARLATIARDTAALLQRLSVQRPIVEAARAAERNRIDQALAEERAQRAAAERRRIEADARIAQVQRAAAVGSALDQHAAIERTLAAVEHRIASLPADESAEALRAWVAVVRAGLVHPLDELVATLSEEASSDVKPPLWWPPAYAPKARPSPPPESPTRPADRQVCPGLR